MDTMRQLTCVGPKAVEWREVPAPQLLHPDDVLLRPVAVARCEIDPFLIMGGPRADDDGFALGHEAVAEVLAVGDAITELSVGQMVLPAFQVSCGVCATCRRGHTASCDEYPVLSDYGMQPLSGVEYGGMLSDVVRVPHGHAMLQPLPAGIDPVDVASVPDNVLDGYRAVAPHLLARPGADVLVSCHGTPSIALYAAQAALALGADSVTFVGTDDTVLELASDLGAVASHTDFGRPPQRYPIVVDCGVEHRNLRYAVAATEPEGACHSVSWYPGDEVGLPLGKMYTRGIQFFVGRANSAALLPEVLALVAEGTLRPAAVTTSVVDWDDAAEGFLADTIKPVVVRPAR
jgi:alcohol dehydrogenase